MHPPTPQPRRPSTSLVGPTTTTTVGALLCITTLVVALLVSRTFTGLLPTDLLGPEGSPGPGVVGVVEVPGTAEVSLGADESYTLWLVRQGSAGTATPGPTFDGDITVDGPDGERLPRSFEPTVSGSSSRDGWTAVTVETITTTAAGVHTVTAPRLADDGDRNGATVLIAPAQPFLPFFTGIFGTVFGVFAAIGAGLVGVPALVLGILWWRSRRRARAAAA